MTIVSDSRNASVTAASIEIAGPALGAPEAVSLPVVEDLQGLKSQIAQAALTDAALARLPTIADIAIALSDVTLAAMREFRDARFAGFRTRLEEEKAVLSSSMCADGCAGLSGWVSNRLKELANIERTVERIEKRASYYLSALDHAAASRTRGRSHTKANRNDKCDSIYLHPLLTPAEEVQLASALIETRHAYWQKLYEIPAIQNVALEQLRRVAKGEIQLESVVFTFHMDAAAPAQRMDLLKSTLSTIDSINEGPSNKTQEMGATIARLLVEFPLPPEDLNECFASVRSGAVTSGLTLSKEQTSAFFSEIAKLQSPYIQIRNYLVLCNTRLARNEAWNGAQRWGYLPSELEQEGRAGLITAAERYIPKHGFRFGTYATHWVRQRISRESSNLAGLVAVPNHHLATLASIPQVEAELRQSGEIATDETVAERLGVDSEYIRVLRPFLAHRKSLNYTRDGHSDAPPLTHLRDHRTASPGEEVEREESLRRVRELLGKAELTPNERLVIMRSTGMDGQPPESLASIGRQLNLTRERVRQIEKNAHQKLASGPLANIFKRLDEDLIGS